MQGIVIRPATFDEWSAWKEIRIKALKDAPESFGERYEDAMQKDDGQWKENFRKVIEAENQEMLFAVSATEIVGMLFVFVRDNDKKIGGIGGLWIANKFRQRGAGKQIVDTALSWMQQKGLLAVTFWNNKSNEASTRFYEKLGFTYTGIEKPLESNPKFVIGEMIRGLK